MYASLKSLFIALTAAFAITAVAAGSSHASPNDPMQDYRIASSLKALKDGHYASAAHGFRLSVNREKDEDRKAQLLVNLCASERLNGDHTAAQNACTAALEIAPTLWQAEVNLALIHEANDHPRLALACYERASDLQRTQTPNSPMPILIAEGLSRLSPQLADAGIKSSN